MLTQCICASVEFAAEVHGDGGRSRAVQFPDACGFELTDTAAASSFIMTGQQFSRWPSNMGWLCGLPGNTTHNPFLHDSVTHILPVTNPLFKKIISIFIYLIIWLYQVLVEAWGNLVP